MRQLHKSVVLEIHGSVLIPSTFRVSSADVNFICCVTTHYWMCMMITNRIVFSNLFAARHYATAVLGVVILSVPLSVTRVLCD